MTSVPSSELRNRIAAAITADAMKPRAERVGLVNAMLAVVQPELDRLRAGAVEREVLLTEARDALEAAGQNGAHGDDWPAVAPAIRALAADRDRLRAELADTVRFRDFHMRSAGHLARKRDRAEQLIGRYRDGDIDAEAVIDRIARTLSVEGDEAPPPPAI